MKSIHMPKRLVTGAALAGAVAISFVCSWPAAAQSHPPAPPAAPQLAPTPRVLIIDRRALLQASKVGQDIARQVQELTRSAESELRGEGDALRKEEQSLQQQVAILAPDVKEQKIRAFQAKQAAFQKKVEERQNEIRYGVMLAQRQVEAAAGPIVEQIMKEHGASLMLDSQSVVIASPGYNVTAVAVQALDQKLPSVKVQLVSPPPDVMARMQQAPQ